MPLPLLLLAAAVQPAPNVPEPSRHWTRIFISPVGEPFRPRQRGEDTMATWFTQADTNHDGYLAVEEMEADAARFFARVDTNHDGEIDPDEVTHYEEVIAPEVQSGSHYSLDGDSGESRRHHGGGRAEQLGYQGASRFSLLDLPEPVAAADEDLSRGISLQEFKHAARRRFVALDVEHQGRLTLAVLETLRPPPPPQPNKPDQSDGGGATAG